MPNLFLASRPQTTPFILQEMHRASAMRKVKGAVTAQVAKGEPVTRDVNGSVVSLLSSFPSGSSSNTPLHPMWLNFNPSLSKYD